MRCYSSDLESFALFRGYFFSGRFCWGGGTSFEITPPVSAETNRVTPVVEAMARDAHNFPLFTFQSRHGLIVTHRREPFAIGRKTDRQHRHEMRCHLVGVQVRREHPVWAARCNDLFVCAYLADLDFFGLAETMWSGSMRFGSSSVPITTTIRRLIAIKSG